MKLAGIINLLLLALPVAAQPVPPQANQHGLNVGIQITHLFAIPDADPNACTNRSSILGRLLAQAAQSGLSPDDVKITMTPDSAVPCAQFETWVEQLPTDYAESVRGDFAGLESGPDSATSQRFVEDNRRQVYIRYAGTVQRNEAGSYRVSIIDSSAPPVGLRLQEDWKVLAPPRYPVPQIARDGDEIPLELYTTDSGVKLMDYIRIGREDKLPPRRKDSARDSYAEDAEFTLTQPRLRVNGTGQESIPLPETIRGALLWVYAPGHGRYILSYAPHPDFERAGEVAGNAAILTVEGNLLRIECAERIAPGGGVYNVYAFHDPDWLPADPQDRDRFMTGTSPAVELAVGR